MSFGDDFAIKDENGNECFYFDGQALSIGKKIIIKGPAREEIARLQQKLFSFVPSYVLTKGGQPWAKISKKLFTFRPAFVVDVLGREKITVVGKMLEHDYRFLRNGKEIARSSKKWFTGKDTYGINVESSVDPLLVLSAAVVVDLVCHPKRDSSF